MKKHKSANLRGQRVSFAHLGRKMKGLVITRIRDTRWLIESPELPADCERWSGARRIVLDRRQFTVSVPAPRSVYGRRSPIESMIDKASGLD